MGVVAPLPLVMGVVAAAAVVMGVVAAAAVVMGVAAAARVLVKLFPRLRYPPRGSIAWLVMIAESGSDEEQVDAACALANVAYLDDASEVAKAGGIAPLVQLVQGGSDEAKMYAAWALKELCHYEDNRGPVGAAGGIAPLVSLCKRGIDFSPSTELAVCLLGSVSQQAAADAPEEEEPAPAPATAGRGRKRKYAKSGGRDFGKVLATQALWNLAWANDDNKMRIAEAIGLHGVVEFAQTGSVSLESGLLVCGASLAVKRKAWQLLIRKCLRGVVPEDIELVIAAFAL